jgi:peptide/nickel transport system substrate-binding protein
MIQTDDNRAGEVIRDLLSQIDLEVQIDQLQNAVWSERWLAGEYDMMFNGSNTDADPDDGHWNFFHSTGPWNTHGLDSPEIDTLLEDTRATVDQEQRREMFLEIARISQEEVSFAFLYHAPDYLAFSNNVKGYIAIPEQRYFEHVWLEE